MKIILYSLNYSPELTGIGKYNGEFVDWLAERNHSIDVITAPPYYPEWIIRKGYKAFFYKKEYAPNVNITRCPIYVPKKVNTIKRLIHLISFALSSSFVLFSKCWAKPDIIILVQPTLFCAPITLLLSKLFKIKVIMHIQDFEIDAMLGLELVKSGRIFRWVKGIEIWLMGKFNIISSISFSMLDNVHAKKIPKERLLYFPNWSDTGFVTPDTNGQDLKESLGFSNEDKIVLYAGNIGEKQGLEIVLKAALNFKGVKNIKFLFVGTGAYVKELKNMAIQLKLENVIFKDLLPWELVPALLAFADIHLVIQKKGAADAVLPSKLTNILSAGGYAIVTADKNTELGRIEEKHPGIFCRIEPENPSLLVLVIKELLSIKDLGYNKVARDYAEKFLDIEKILPVVEKKLIGLT